MYKRWKRVESAIAQRLGGKRIPLLGRQGCDVETPILFVEVKSRASIAPYLWNDFFAQIIEGAKQVGERKKVPAIVIHRPGMDYDDALLCIRVGDYARLTHAITISLKQPNDNERNQKDDD
jgi:hypothetical protein